MLIGDPSVFAVESVITVAYERLSFRALGLFVIHLGSRRYGVYEPDATMLAVSFDTVERRIRERGNHVAAFSSEENPAKVAKAFRETVYGTDRQRDFFGLTADKFRSSVSDVQWAPDGDEAFDDGSYVLQFDVGDRVRLIAFKSSSDGSYDPASLTEIWITSDNFYSVLECWHSSFLEEWTSLPKVAA